MNFLFVQIFRKTAHTASNETMYTFLMQNHKLKSKSVTQKLMLERATTFEYNIHRKFILSNARVIDYLLFKRSFFQKSNIIYFLQDRMTESRLVSFNKLFILLKLRYKFYICVTRVI